MIQFSSNSLSLFISSLFANFCLFYFNWNYYMYCRPKAIARIKIGRGDENNEILILFMKNGHFAEKY